MHKLIIHLALVAALLPTLSGSQWTESKRGSWLTEDSGFAITQGLETCVLVLGREPADPVRTAAELLAQDIERITGSRPEISETLVPGRPAIVFHNAAQHKVPEPELAQWLEQEYEAFHIEVTEDQISLFGSDALGTAYAAYELSERIGIDPLYIWTGYTPERRANLHVPLLSYRSGSPDFRYRGFFHDDEDILPRPMHPKVDMPDPNGTIDDSWYQRYFETAVRLKQNMVAPYTRTQRNQHIYEMANRYGLYLTTHHYDVLMSNVWGFKRHGLAKAQGLRPVWNVQTNLEDLETYWRNAVEELAGMDVVWSIGMRADGDSAYEWPEGTTDADKRDTYVKVHDIQMGIVEDILGPGQEFAFTAWGEMHRYMMRGLVQIPENVMTIWSDKVPPGYMKGLPEPDAPGRHGIYYHLAILSGANQVVQNASIVSPDLIADQFQKIFAADATEYLLVNISEMREFIREGRMLAQISTEGSKLLDQEDPAQAFRDWFSKEYFGAEAAPLVSQAYADYFELVPEAPSLYEGNIACLAAIDAWGDRLNGEADEGYNPTAVNETLQPLIVESDRILGTMESAKQSMSPEQVRFFEENCELPLRMLSQPAKAAYALNAALAENSDFAEAKQKAMEPLIHLEAMLVSAERSPFERWYGYTWPKRTNPPTDPRLALQRLRAMED